MRTTPQVVPGRAVCLVLLVAVGAVASWPRQAPRAEAKPPPAEEFTLSGPYHHENLTVFLIHGKDRIKPGRLLTLQEALEQNKAVVHETGQVSSLEVENVSQDADVFIQSGDIIKGGKQDRLISFDLVLPPKSGKVAIAVCCVEQGRWQQRGKENVSRFSVSTGQLPSKALKFQGGNFGQFGAQGGGQGVVQGMQFGLQGGGQFGNQGGQFGQFGGQSRGQFGQFGGQFGVQGGVWTEVGQIQQRLGAKLGAEVQKTASQSSLQLTLEHPKVKGATEKYTRALAGVIADRKDVIGYAFAVNGEVNTIEVYGCAELFAKLWPKLLKANALEAFLEHEDLKSFPKVRAHHVRAVMADADGAKAVEKEVSKRVQVRMRETDKGVLFETWDRDRGVWVHRSYLTK